MNFRVSSESETESETPLSDSDSMPPLDPPLESDTSDSDSMPPLDPPLESDSEDLWFFTYYFKQTIFWNDLQ